jgi:integrase
MDGTSTIESTETASPPTLKAKRAGKRAHGEGSISYEADRKKWRVSVALGFVSGKRRRKQLRFNTQQEARHALTRLQKNIDDGIGVGDDKITVGAFLERWLRDCVEGPLSKLRAASRVSYAHITRNHVVPGLGHHPLAKLSPLHIEAFLSSKLEDGALSAATVRHLHKVLRAALRQAEKWGLVARNVAKLVDAVPLPKHEACSLTTEQAGQLLAALNGDRSSAKNEKRRALTSPDRLRALFVVAMMMGLRRGEIAGLRWADIDLERGEMRVRQQVVREKIKRNDKGERIGGGLVATDLKTDKSRRAFKLPAAVAAELREHERRQKAERLKAGPLWRDSGHVFTTIIGTRLDGRDIHAAWRRALDDAGLPGMRFHSTRHSAASFLIAHGADLRTVMGVLGHSSIALTADLYTHMLDEVRADAASKMDAAFKAANDAARR